MRHILFGGLMVALALTACGDDSEPTGGGNGGGVAATSVSVVSGNNQRVAVSRSTLSPLVVKVSDSEGGGVSGQIVTWEVTTGGGSVSSTTTTTDGNGEASVSLSAGSTGEDNTVTATVSSLSPASFTVKAVSPASVVITAGDGQTARTSQPLAGDFEVRVTAGDNGPVPNLPVAWAATAGGGSLSAGSTTTDADGRASSSLTLGGAAGVNTATATPSDLPAVTLNASATVPVTVLVNMQGIAFVAPGGGDDVTIMLGDTIRWENQDGVQHTATSTSMPSGGSAFDSGFLSSGQSFTFVPNTRGEWVYFCEVHPTIMTGARITVQ